MNYIKFGRTGLDVSRICLGCMGFGERGTWIHDWVLEEDAARAVIRRALEMGINFFDTANVYSGGTSEQFLGRALKDYASRDEVVIATKVYFPMKEGPNTRGLSRKHILDAADASLKRLGTDYIDLYIIHRWDCQTPIEETMEALDSLVRAGKVRYLGASAMYAWQFQKARNISCQHGWHSFVSMQNHWNLLYREDEREMVPYCVDSGVALTPYSPLASGRLARAPGEQATARLSSDAVAREKYEKTAQQDVGIILRVQMLAQRYGVPMSSIALAWLLSRPMLAAPVIGATKVKHVEDAVRAVEIKLTAQDTAFLEEPYVPHAVVGAL